MSSIGIIVLAAGASTRLGSPKQLLLYGGKSLLCRAVETALASSCQPVVVVLGAHRQSLASELEGLSVRIVENTEWEQGMGSSIRAGMEALLAEAADEPDAVLLMLCDQPQVSAQTLNRLLEAHRSTGHPIVASEYGQTLGVPALFSRALFPELARLTGAEGAKQIIQRYRNRAIGVPCPEALMDIDTLDDYARLREKA
jgi:molybdenum cofactor cytidylyltransferase